MWANTVLSCLSSQQELSPGAFALSDAVVQNGAVLSGTDPIDVTTSLEQWAFAVTFPFRRDALGAERAEGPLLVRIEAVVQSGCIGIGCVAGDLRTYLSPEIERMPEGRGTVFDLILGPIHGESCGW